MINPRQSKKQHQVTLSFILKKSNLKIKDFCELLGIHRVTLNQYRKNNRQLRLSTQQIKILIKLLRSIDIDFLELSDNWIVDDNE